MVKADGIEVYLKPVGSSENDVKFPEVEFSTADDDQRRFKRCFVPFSDVPVEIVIKFSEDYNMFSADVMHIGIGIASKQFVGLPPLPSWCEWVYGYRARLQLESRITIPKRDRRNFGIPEQLKDFEFVPAVHVPGQQISFTSWQGQPLQMPGVNEDFIKLCIPKL